MVNLQWLTSGPWWLAGAKILGTLVVGGLVVVFVTPYLVPLPEAPEIPDPRQDIPDDKNAWPAIVAVIHQMHPAVDMTAQEAATARMTQSMEAVQRAGLMNEYDRAAAQQAPSDNPIIREAVEANLQFSRVLMPQRRLSIDPRDETQATALVEQYAPQIEALDAALERPGMQLPFHADPVYSANAVTYLTGMADLVQLKLARARLRFSDGQSADGMGDILTVLRLGQRLQAAGSDHHSLGSIALRFSTSTMLHLLGPAPDIDPADSDPTIEWPRAGWSEAEQAVWREALDELQALDLLGGFRNGQAARLYADRATMEAYDGRRWPGLRTVLWDELFYDRLMRRVIAAIQEQAALPEAARDLRAIEALARPSGWRKAYGVGTQYVLTLAADTAGTQLSLYDHLRTTRVTAVGAIAIKLYLERHGRLPTDWGEVVSDGLLTAPPEDPYTGEALGYEPDRGLLIVAGSLVQEILRKDDLNYHYLEEKLARAFPDPADQAKARRIEYHALPFVTGERPTPWHCRTAEEVESDSAWVMDEYHRRMGSR